MVEKQTAMKESCQHLAQCAYHFKRFFHLFFCSIAITFFLILKLLAIEIQMSYQTAQESHAIQQTPLLCFLEWNMDSGHIRLISLAFFFLFLFSDDIQIVNPESFDLLIGELQKYYNDKVICFISFDINQNANSSNCFQFYWHVRVLCTFFRFRIRISYAKCIFSLTIQ